MEKNTPLPRSRVDGLVIKELPDELLIYDLGTNKAFCLNQTARLILNECDGKTTVEAAQKKVAGKLGSDVDEQVFWMGLTQLRKNGLLEEDEKPIKIPKVSRRYLAGAGLMLPAVTMLIAPTPAQAATGACLPAGVTCVQCNQCCSG